MLPANTVVHVTVYNYDGQSGLRNPFISQAQGIGGGTFRLNGKPTKAIGPDTASHIFAIPQLGRARSRSRASPTTPRTSAPTRRAG